MSEHNNWINLVRRWLIKEIDDQEFLDRASEMEMDGEAQRAIDDRDFELGINKLDVVGRTIVAATIWMDGTNASIVLDDDTIIQIQAYPKPGDELREALVKWQIEFPPNYKPYSGSNQT